MAKSDKNISRKQRVMKSMKEGRGNQPTSTSSYEIDRVRKLALLGTVSFFVFWALAVSSFTHRHSAYEGVLDLLRDPMRLAVTGLFSAVIFSIFLGYHRGVKALSNYTVSRWVGLVILLMAVPLCSAMPDRILPFNGIPFLVVAMLLRQIFPPAFVFFHMFLSLLVMGVFRGYGVEDLVPAMAGIVPAVLLHRRGGRRFAEIRVGFIAGLALCFADIAMDLQGSVATGATFQHAVLGMLSLWAHYTLHVLQGLASVFVVMLFMPVVERVFDVVSDATLLELSDHNNELLRDLLFRAPGTYNHSLMVATLAEEAAHEVGANALACRVCSYYHDIGKMLKPEYFTENELGKNNKHIDLSPSISALIITSHPKDGLEMAQEHKLPTIVKDVIMQHHGTSKIEFFYRKALQIKDDDETVDESLFRYPGPKPNSKESGIIMLADSVEASTRSLSDPTASRIRSLVHSIVQHKVEDHQLDHCPMTMHELFLVKESFIRMLTAIFHSRVPYPEKNKGK